MVEITVKITANDCDDLTCSEIQTAIEEYYGLKEDSVDVVKIN